MMSGGLQAAADAGGARRPIYTVISWQLAAGRARVCSVPCALCVVINAPPHRAALGWGKGGNVTSAGWQVILCDPIWHVSSRSG